MGGSKSELIRKSITEFIGRSDKPSPWELGSDVLKNTPVPMKAYSGIENSLLEIKAKQ